MAGTAAFYTLGCKLNFSESSALARQMEEIGFNLVPFQQGADVYVVNTCSVTDHADKKCRKVVNQALRLNPQAKVVVVGCYAQLKPREIIEIPGVDLVLGAAEKFQLAKYVQEIAHSKEPKVIAGPITEVQTFQSAFSFNDRTRSFLKVQDGCDYSCTFCTIPLARGSSRSDSIEQVVQKARHLAATGVKEIVLTGVNLGDFGKQPGLPKNNNTDFFNLITALDQVEGIDRFRISSIEPNLLDDRIIEFVASSNRFVPHFHIPLQSGSDKILKAMRRRYLTGLYASRVEKIKKMMPHACMGVDVITGFPGETNQDFLDTYAFIRDLNVSYLHVFTYSERADTLAISMPGKVPGAVRQDRTAQLIQLSDKLKRAFYTPFVGSIKKVLFEAETENNMMFGFTDNYLRVQAPFDPLWVNEVVEVELAELLPDTIFSAGEGVLQSDTELNKQFITNLL